MSGILSGLADLGLGDLEGANLFEEPKEENGDKQVVHAPKVQEKDLIFDKGFDCPVCEAKFTNKIMKTGKSKLLRTDNDFRPVFELIDAQKYDVNFCPKCGFSALSRYFKPMSSVQVKALKEKIAGKVQIEPRIGEIYTYEEAMQHYKLALACAVVKQAKASEKAYICLKSAWLCRGWQETLEAENGDSRKVKDLKTEEREYLKNALEGFVSAISTESFPMCGMDESTVEYLVAVLAYEFGKYDISSRLIASVLTSHSANARMKDKARELKDMLLVALKKTKE